MDSHSDLADVTLAPIGRSRLYEQVIARVRDHIDIQGLEPGDRLLPEREMAERLGVSRTSLRQALTALEVMGLIEVRHGGGAFITQPPEALLPHLAAALADAHEQLPAIMEVRQAIETQTARLAGLRRTQSDIEGLARALEEMAKAGADVERAAEADRHFHDGIAVAARSPLLYELWAHTADPIDFTRRASLARPGRPAASLRAHRRIFDAIVSGDGNGAARAMRKHLDVVADVGFLDTLRHLAA
jgi:GntR family transcriptional repressor for pyruvate dehydrogenase complex